jgi:lipopolysaccharide export system protein LptC
MWIFRTDAFKLILALSILGTIVGLMFYAQNMANRIEKEAEEQRRLNPTAVTTSIDNYELKEIDDANHIRWILRAKRAVLEKDRKFSLDSIDMRYFDDGKEKMHLIAPIGMADEASRQIQLDSNDKQKVIAMGQEGKSRLETSKLELTKKNQFKATGGVNIDWTGVAKVTGNYATGVLGKADLEDLKIIGNTHAVIQ